MAWDTADAESLFQTILALEGLEEAKGFFRDLLTESEIAELSNRWKAARLLDRKVPYRRIAKETGLSSTTIARISKWLAGGQGGYRTAIAKDAHHALSPLGKG